LCVVAGGGHYWPGGKPWPNATTLCGTNNGVLAATPVADDLIWSFLSAFSLSP
jgi:hypothetical protein